MLRLGAMPDKACQMDLDHLFICRLKLLIIMTRTYLEGYPLGTTRKAALISNADHIAAESVDLEQLVPVRSKQAAMGGMDFDYVFYQRVKLLASMTRAIGSDQAIGEHRRAALADNVDMICNALKFTSGVKKVAFLKVA